jgi:hypothetical protein
MGSVTMIYIPSFSTTVSVIQKEMRGSIQTHKEHGDLKSLLLFKSEKALELLSS